MAKISPSENFLIIQYIIIIRPLQLMYCMRHQNKALKVSLGRLGTTSKLMESGVQINSALLVIQLQIILIPKHYSKVFKCMDFRSTVK